MSDWSLILVEYTFFSILLRGWLLVFCLVTITFASPKVSVTVSKQVPRGEEMSPRGFKIISKQLSVSRCQIGH